MNVDAAFVYFRPRETSRVCGPDLGVWYPAFEIETSIAEITWHRHGELERFGDYHTVSEQAEMWERFADAYVRLRGVKPPP